MSQYVNFFIRKQIKDTVTFIPLGSFSRNSEIYQASKNAPFEKIRSISGKQIDNIVQSLYDNKKKFEDRIKEVEHNISYVIPTFNNSAKEKMEEIAEQQLCIDDIYEEIADLQFAIGYFSSLKEILWDNDPEGFFDDKTIYYGIEISDPTEEDVV